MESTKLAKNIRKLSLRMGSDAKAPHIGSAQFLASIFQRDHLDMGCQ